MKITEFTHLTIVGDIEGQPADAMAQLTYWATAHKAIYMGPARKPDGSVVYGTNWAVDSELGLQIADCDKQPASIEGILKLGVPLSLPLFINRQVWELLGGWPDLPNGDSYGVVALGLKAYFSRAKIRCCLSAVCNYTEPPAASLLNAHFVHRAYFSDEVYQHIWSPMLLRRDYVPEITAVLQSDELMHEAQWLEEHRQVAEELFFRKVLLHNMDSVLDIDRETGRAMPANQAVYVGYEARRSPGREWGHDQARQRKHINALVAYLKEQGRSLGELDLLDVGSRDGWSLEVMSKLGFNPVRLQGLEISIWSARHGREKGRPVLCGDAHDLSRWLDSSFNVVTSWHSLEHCHSPDIVLAEIHRVLRSDGIMMLVVPLENKGLSTAGDHCYAMRSTEAVLQLTETAGFKCAEHNDHPREFTGFFVKAE